MQTPLTTVEVPSIYKLNGRETKLPPRMAKCTPDMGRVIAAVTQDLAAEGGRLVLSDLFRSYDMQLKSHMDFVSGKKTAFSPAPGGSLHEAGRAFDLDLSQIHVPLNRFWEIGKAHGLSPIIDRPEAGKSESWHFDCRGSHDLVYRHYAAGRAGNMKPYTAMAVSAILAIGVKVDALGTKRRQGYIQSGLIRLGFDIGPIDGVIGQRTRDAIAQLGADPGDLDVTVAAMELQLQARFPDEY